MRKGILLLTALLAVVGCDSSQEALSQNAAVVNSPVVDVHNAQISLDWAGVYEGVTPCADCDGIKTTVTLSTDGTYEINRVYLGKAGDAFIDKGVFNWSDSGSSILLEAAVPVQFFVAENALFMLDSDGKRIEGALSSHYRLAKKAE